MSALALGVSAGQARLVADQQYYDVACQLIAQARNICLASLFIVDLKTSGTEPDLKVYELLKLLQQAQWRGVRTRLLIGGSRENVIIAESAEIARYAGLRLDLECKWLTSEDVRGSHSKLVVSDNSMLIGSHNWSAPAFTNQIQDSLLIESSGLAAYFAAYFDRQWNRG
jgi:phosphatidylserine/phosphatidylglycerophosphate/cardiolipin synthase-like enzyme